MDYSEIKHCILALRSGTISEEQRRKLDEWISAGDQRRELVDRLCDDESVAEDLDLYASFDPERAWQKMQHKKQHGFLRASLLRMSKYAAAVVLLLSALFVVVQTGIFRPKSIGELAGIKPGSVRATLIVDNDRRIELEGLRDTAIYSKSESRAYIGHDGLLNYREQNTSHLVSEHTILIPRGGEYKMTLCDGTQVWLNSDSQLSYPAEFPDSVRRVKLIGEAYFAVAKDSKRPFIVETNSMDVCALGTAFNVSAYSEDQYVATTLVEGKVRISTSEEEAILEPGEQGVAENNNKKLAIEQVKTELYANWTEERFVFERESIDEVMKKLARWYNFSYQFDNASVMAKHFTGKLPKYSDIDQVFSIIELTTDIHFKLKDKMIIIK